MAIVNSCSECKFVNMYPDEWPCKDCIYNGGTHEYFTPDNCNRCITCGAIIPEGRHICLTCERGNDMQTFQPSKKSKSKNYWIRLDDDFNEYKFLCCGFEFCFDEGHPKENGVLYCPHCGVKMEN